jgi:thiosulfate dehydrogenase
MIADVKKMSRLMAVPAVIAAIVAANPSAARAPYTEEELAQHEAALNEMVLQGYNMWHGSEPSMTTNGLACGNCHPDTAASNPQTFPKYMPMFGKVVPFREMVNWCIKNPQLGEALDVNSDAMTAMEAYAFMLHRDKPIEPGLATRQTTPIVVQSGTGFPRQPSGIGYDK